MKKEDVAILSIEEKRELLKKLLLNKQVNDTAWWDTPSSKLNGQSISNRFDSTSNKIHKDEPASIPTNQGNVIIESMGVYLPEKSVATQTILDECANKLNFPLGRMTGIESRRMAGDHEFAIDLAQKAIDDCFAHSTYSPEDIDLLISCNISRYDGPEIFSFEPNTSAKLVNHFSFKNALSFDISNACAGFFTAIQIAESFIKNGTVKRALVVSGEYITHLTNTAQKEIDGFMDPRIACLTLGDAGAAVILEKSADDKMGLLELDLFTEGKYHPLCVAKVTEADHGGAIMYTDSIGMTTVSLNQAVAHADFILNKRNWGIDSADFVIMHQTSELAINSAIQTTNDFYHKKLCTPANTLINLTTRGNTASTSHFVALYDFIKRQLINNNDKIIFSIAASGRTIGTALYALNDLPDKIRQPVRKKKPEKKINGHKLKAIEKDQHASRVKIESVGLITEGLVLKRDVIEIAKISAENCLNNSAYENSDINLLMYSGIYRNDFMLEPAIAAILAGELHINEEITSPAEAKTFAFDVFNGGNGLLNACYIAVQFIRTKKYRNSMIVTAEIENNADIPSKKLMDLQETGSALLLDESKSGNSGFGNFVFKNYPQYIGAITTYAKLQRGEAYLHLDIDPHSEDYYISCIPDAVNDLLAIEQINISDIKAIFPPQVSSSFITKLSDKMNIDKKKLIDFTDGKKDLFNSSFTYALEYAKQQNMVSAGDIGLIINISSGIQVGCAIYYF